MKIPSKSLETTRKILIKVLIFTCFWLISSIPAKGDLVLVIRPKGNDFTNFVKSLKEALGNECMLHELVLTPDLSERKTYERVSSTYPRMVLLLDNEAVRLFKKYQASQMNDTVNITPSISLMGIQINRAIEGIKNGAGISYEVPLVSSIQALRAGVKLPIKRAGVIHREFMNNYIETGKIECKKIGVEIVSRSLPDNLSDYKSAVKANLRDLLQDEKVDAMLVPNDNRLLCPEIIRDVWIPSVKRCRKPVAVGAEILANPQLDFGTVSVLPDHNAMSSQVAEMIFEARGNDWKFQGPKTLPPVSVIKIINARQAIKHYLADVHNTDTFDKIKN